MRIKALQIRYNSGEAATRWLGVLSRRQSVLTQPLWAELAIRRLTRARFRAGLVPLRVGASPAASFPATAGIIEGRTQERCTVIAGVFLSPGARVLKRTARDRLTSRSQPTAAAPPRRGRRLDPAPPGVSVLLPQPTISRQQVPARGHSNRHTPNNLALRAARMASAVRGDGR